MGAVLSLYATVGRHSLLYPNPSTIIVCCSHHSVCLTSFRHTFHSVILHSKCLQHSRKQVVTSFLFNHAPQILLYALRVVALFLLFPQSFASYLKINERFAPRSSLPKFLRHSAYKVGDYTSFKPQCSFHFAPFGQSHFTYSALDSCCKSFTLTPYRNTFVIQVYDTCSCISGLCVAHS